MVHAAVSAAAQSTGLPSVSPLLTMASCCDMQIQSQLLGWYDKSHRALPWRRNPHTQTAAADDPEHKALLELPQQQMIYRVWLSEIMCQQTQVSMTLRAADQQLPPVVCNQQHCFQVQVARASDYFRRWLLKWPDVQSLAGATLDEVHCDVSTTSDHSVVRLMVSTAVVDYDHTRVVTRRIKHSSAAIAALA